MTYKFSTLKTSKYRFIYCCFLLFFLLQSSFAQNSTEQIPFSEVVTQLEQKFEVKFSYNSETAKRFQVKSPITSNLLSEILNEYSTGNNILFSFVHERYITVQFPVIYVNFCVKFINTQTGEPIDVVLIGNNATYTSTNGITEITSIADDEKLQVYVEDQFVKELIVYETKNSPNKCPLIFINTQYVNKLPTVTLKSYIAKGIKKTSKGAITIKNSDFEILPSLVEPDILQIAQVLPGVESYDETASNINIRGGASDEVTILWNDIRMYQTGHFFGLISAFNPNLINNVLIYKNGTHPRYSEGVSGVLHMYPTNTINSEIDGSIGVNLSSLNAYMKLPISPTFAVHASGRASINNGIGNPIYKSFFERTFQNTEITNLNSATTEAVRTTDEDFNFYDISISALWDISPKDHLNYHFMTIHNKLQFTERIFLDAVSTATFNEIRQNTLLGGFNYKRNWNSKLTTSLQYSASTYTDRGDTRQIEIISEASQRNRVREQSVKFDGNYILNELYSLEIGYNYTNTTIDDNQILATSAIPINNESNLITNGYYLRGNATLFDDRTDITLGGRLTNLSGFDNQFEPRLTINHTIEKDWNAFLAAEMKHQSVLQFTTNENQILAIENRKWLIADGITNPLLKSTQFSMGTDYTKNKWTLSGEGYYKKVEGINTRNLGFRNQLKDVQAIGHYKAYGLEASIGKQINNLSTWLSYTYSNSAYEFNTLHPQKFPANFNVTHALNAIVTYKLNTFTVSAGANYHSGLPYTTPTSNNAIATVNGISEITYNSPNNATLKPYFRTNISAVYEAKLDPTFSTRINVALLNIFDTKNELSSYYEIETNAEGASSINRIDQFSLGFTPNISFQLLF